MLYLNFRWSQEVANNFLSIFHKATHSISNDPKRFPIFIRKMNIRKCVVTKHNIIYFVEYENVIQILRIYDTRQNPHKLKF